jgi:LmbE family N-acetylglucosaminyl deacetylase
MANPGNEKLESSHEEGLRGVMEYLTGFRRNKGTFAYPRFETLDLSNHPRLLVLAPHPDDDVIGCGGTIRKAVQKGAKVKVVYLTDGRFGNNSYSEKELIEIRKTEALNGLRVLGCDDAVFFGNPDMGLQVDEQNVGRLHQLLEEYHPTAIFIPSFQEMPPDHLMTARIAAHALRRYEREVQCYGYEVWVPLIPTILVDITDVIEIKVEAIRQHRSQVAVSDYSVKIKGLNSYRSMYARKEVDYCEAFTLHSRIQFVELANGLGVFSESGEDAAKSP